MKGHVLSTQRAPHKHKYSSRCGADPMQERMHLPCTCSSASACAASRTFRPKTSRRSRTCLYFIRTRRPYSSHERLRTRTERNHACPRPSSSLCHVCHVRRCDHTAATLVTRHEMPRTTPPLLLGFVLDPIVLLRSVLIFSSEVLRTPTFSSFSACTAFFF